MNIYLRLSPTIRNEYAVRGVFGGGDPEYPEIPEGSMVWVSGDTARKILEDAEFQIDPDGPFGKQASREDIGVKSAYRALAKKIRADLVRNKEYGA